MIVYQYTTNYPLALSKGYFFNHNDARKRIEEVITTTNDFRKSKGFPLLTSRDIENGLRVLKINPSLLSGGLRKLGPHKSITVTNLEDRPEVKWSDLGPLVERIKNVSFFRFNLR